MTAKKKSEKENDKELPKEEIKYPLKILKDNCVKLYGVTSSTFAGATKNIPDGKYSINEVRKIIKEWLKKEVK